MSVLGLVQYLHFFGLILSEKIGGLSSCQFSDTLLKGIASASHQKMGSHCACGVSWYMVEYERKAS